MPDTFHRHIRTALADPNLQVALDANAERRVRVRQSAFASLEDPEGMRRQAHAVRAEVVDHLDEYLVQFIEKAQANGMQIHRAANAGEAVAQVINISRQHNATLIAKSKTMVSEEIHLNHALEAAGLQVVETDLGEYIVQLRHETPSHIITPAVHLRRADVGRLFEEKLGLPYTEDIPQMTNAARQALREVFLSADIGLTGVNFAIANTGMLCMLTNEGNGRMVTTVPKIHIALLGMERLVPNLDDLALMLRLLPRSATGQKLTVYTSLLHGPRRPGDPDGPEERHVIIVDNGRSALRQTPLREILYCIRCGSCLNACPVFREIGGHAYVGKSGQISPYPGPIGSVLAPGLFGQAEFGQLARASSLCGACREACPVDIDLPKLLLRVRAGMVEPVAETLPTNTAIIPNPPGWLAFGLKIYTWAAEHPGRFALTQRLAGWLLGGSGWLRLPSFTGWGFSKDFPRPARQTFHQRWMSGIISPGVESHVRKNKAGEVPALPDEEHRDSHEFSDAEKIENLEKALVELGAKFMLCREAEAAETIVEMLQKMGEKVILAWDETCLPVGTLKAIQAAGIQVLFHSTQALQDSARVRVGLTGALGAAAETGSLALTGGPGRPLTTSLLPEVHIVFLRKETVVSRLDELLKLPDLSQAAASVLISGPSRTADIEMTLTIGVHGPGELYVVCF